MSCGTGCTDCPTCRGEVQPDAPVMHDMRFAMAMNSGPMSQDRFLGPYGMIQIVRDGIRHRGAAAVGDTVMLQVLDDVTRTRPGSDMFAMSMDDAPVQPAPKPPKDDGPKPPPTTTPSAPPKNPWDITDEWTKYIQGLPDLPKPNNVTGKESCNVIQFDYPIPESFKGDPSNGRKSPKKNPGFVFMAHLKYDPNPPYACECCVFRQWLEKYNFNQRTKELHRDNKTRRGTEYGGSREDGSNGTTPDNPKKEAAGTLINTPCEMKFKDLPGEAGIPTAGSWELRYNFIGVVFDRCNNWKPVAVKGFRMQRKTTYQFEGGAEQELVVRDEPDSVKWEPLNGPPE